MLKRLLPVEIWNQLIFLMTHARSEMGDTNISLLGPSQITLRNQNVAHGQHTQTSKFFGSVKHNWRKS